MKSIRTNLYQLLLRLSAQFYSRKIWIDAICINQTDVEEKNKQIPLMYDIHSRASKVLVWLGEATEEEQKAFHEVPTLDMILSEEEPMTVTPQDLVQMGLPPTTDELWQSICMIFFQPWFRRVWTVPELVLAKDVTLCYGATQCSWDTLSAAISSTCSIKKLLVSIISSMIASENRRYVCQGVVAMIALKRYRCNVVKSLTSVHTLLAMFMMKEVSVSHNGVYGMLGLIDEVYSKDITVDVDLPLDEVYQSFSRTCLRHDPQLGILHWISPAGNGPAFPSWCLNLEPTLARLPKGRDCATEEQDGFHTGYLAEGWVPNNYATPTGLHTPTPPTSEVTFPSPHVLRIKDRPSAPDY